MALILLSPLLLALGIAVKLESPGPVFFRGERTGRNGHPFRIFKFRSMVVGAEHIGGSTTKLNDPRVTPFGAFLRRTKLDELPQLINVLRGEMSIVGPRPEMEEYTRLYDSEEREILTVRPGITDFASIRFVDLASTVGADDADAVYQEKVLHAKNRLRIKYVRELSLAVDLQIIRETLKALFRDRKTWR